MRLGCFLEDAGCVRVRVAGSGVHVLGGELTVGIEGGDRAFYMCLCPPVDWCLGNARGVIGSSCMSTMRSAKPQIGN